MSNDMGGPALPVGWKAEKSSRGTCIVITAPNGGACAVFESDVHPVKATLYDLLSDMLAERKKRMGGGE